MLLRQTTIPIKVVDTKQTSKLTVTIAANQKTIYSYSVHVIEYKHGNTSNQLSIDQLKDTIHQINIL